MGPQDPNALPPADPFALKPQGYNPMMGNGGMPQGMPPPNQYAGAPGTMPGQGQGSAVTPELMQAILALQGQGSQRSAVDRQYALADQLRGDAGGFLKPKNAGRLVVGPRWYDAAASLGKQWEAGQNTREADTKGKALDEQTQGASQKLIEALKQTQRSGL